MYNPFDIIPKTLDSGLRNLIIALITIQVTCFIIYIVYMFYSHFKLKGTQQLNKNENKDVQEESKTDKLHNE